jgi:hypothetical protein
MIPRHLKLRGMHERQVAVLIDLDLNWRVQGNALIDGASKGDFGLGAGLVMGNALVISDPDR